MIHGSRTATRAFALLALGLAAACGSSRKVADDRPLCQRCHGGLSGNAAPPQSVKGATATTDLSVGAHQAHLLGGRLRGPIACDECHVVPADMDAHEAGIAAVQAGTASRVVFGTLASRGTTTAPWNRAAETCRSIYCHGATLNHGGGNHEPPWTLQDPTHLQTDCGSCHGYPPPAPHPADSDCVKCHSSSVNTDNASIRFAGDGSSTHLDGALTVDGLACNTCHGYPPTTGAHALHTSAAVAGYGDLRKTADVYNAAATSYAFGCGNCHPLDWAKHDLHFTASAPVFVELTPGGATAGSLRSLSLNAAAYNAATKGCSGTYCHSSGQASVAPPKVVPTWNGTAGSLGCAGCHGDPPDYPNDGPGSSSANSHVGLLDFNGDLIATGHFMGLPAALHQGSAHGGGIGTQFAGDSAAPITCQTCHFNTVDPTNTGPSGFYYRDTSGSYVSPVNFATSSNAPIVVHCESCHNGSPAGGTGKVMPYFHVNGQRDVAFDRRTDFSTATGTPTLPAAPNKPTRPYWYTGALNGVSGAPYSLVPNAVAASQIPGIGLDGTTLSLDLNAAVWNATTKSCSSVTCHLNHLQTASPPMRWGEFGAPNAPLDPMQICGTCHNN